MKIRFAIFSFILLCVLNSCNENSKSKDDSSTTSYTKTIDSNQNSTVIYKESIPTEIDQRNIEKILAKPYNITKLHNNKHPILQPKVVQF